MLETGFNPSVGKIPWRRKWQPTPVFLAWKIPWMEKPGRLQSMGSKKLEITEWLHVLFRWYLTSLVAQRLKHLPPIQETQVWSLGWENVNMLPYMAKETLQIWLKLENLRWSDYLGLNVKVKSNDINSPNQRKQWKMWVWIWYGFNQLPKWELASL